jgi:hypothetical protein
MLEFILTAVGAASGVALKVVWDAIIDRRREVEKAQWDTRLQDLRDALSKFYWPLYLRLQRDNIIWERLLERTSKNEERRRLARKIEQEVLIPNHREILRLLEQNLHLAIPDPSFDAELLKYVKHADLYLCLRSADIWDKDPIAFDEPWPHDFFPAIERRLRELQREHDAILEVRRAPATTGSAVSGQS